MDVDDDFAWPALVPELLVTDLVESLRCYLDEFGFVLRDRRGDPPFALVSLGAAAFMLEETADDSWVTADMARPFGRGVNFEIDHPDPEALAARLVARGRQLFRPPTRRVYRSRGVDVTQVEFLVMDPDGYLMRFVREEPSPAAPRP
jgi:hypothetical protein